MRRKKGAEESVIEGSHPSCLFLHISMIRTIVIGPGSVIIIIIVILINTEGLAQLTAAHDLTPPPHHFIRTQIVLVSFA